jgi:hypothetical protein
MIIEETLKIKNTAAEMKSDLRGSSVRKLHTAKSKPTRSKKSQLCWVGGGGWLMSVNLATQEQRFGGSRFKASPGKKLVKPHLNQLKLSTVAHASHLSYQEV